MTKLTIKVTKEILKRSMMCSIFDRYEAPTNCAIALAVRDIFPDALIANRHIYPFPDVNYKKSHNFGLSILLPNIASSFICTFDSFSTCPENRLLMAELKFNIEIPDEIVEKINIDEIKSLLVNHPNLILS